MQVTATDAARAVVARARQERSGQLTITIGTGCCESTAPFLYENFWPGPDQEPVGDVGGVQVFAPAYLRKLYPGDDGVVIDSVVVDAESLSIETAWGERLILRGHGVDAGAIAACDLPRTVDGFDATDPERPGARVRGELPDALRQFRIR
jgi:uncharacterized protein (DUF779 family)